MSGWAGEHPRDLLSSFLDDELTAAERAEVEAHLSACSECREHLLSLRALSSALREQPVPPVPAGLEDRIGRRLDTETVVPFRRRFAIPATIAATIAAIGLVSVVVFEERRNPEPPVFAPPAPHAATPQPTPQAENLRRLEEGKDNKKLDDEPRASQRQKSELESRRSVAKEKTAPAPPPAPPVARDELAKAPSPVPEGGVAGGVERDALSYVGNAPVPAEKQARAAQAVAAPSTAFAAGCPDEVGIADAPVDGTWLVGDTDEATRRIAVLALKLGGRLMPRDAHEPMTLVVEIPAARYPSFITGARAMDVLGLDDVRTVQAAGCVRQRIVLRRVVVN